MTQRPAPARLLLENGRVFHGFSAGAPGEAAGEVCFHTGMTGWQEMLSDPSYSGQLLLLTAAHVGNTGVLAEDMESGGVRAAGLLARSICREPSGARGGRPLPDWLRESGVPAIEGLDTRTLTRVIRDEGAQNGLLTTSDASLEALRERLAAVPSMEGLDLASRAGCTAFREEEATTPERFRVAVLDCGVKASILTELRARGCRLGVFPAKATAGELLAWKPDGIFVSNGPGDPAAVTATIATLRELPPALPLFGICLGHQLLALAHGGRTLKLPFGHHGANHPVRDAVTGRVWITSQNHGFAVDPSGLPPSIRVTHESLNDGTVEGLELLDRPAFSVQFHPEAAPGPREARVCFDSFVARLEAGRPERDPKGGA